VVPLSPVWMRVCAIDVVLDQPQGGFIGGIERRAAPILARLRKFPDRQASMKKTHRHCDGKHLHRYLAEFHFRYNTRPATTTSMRAEELAISIKGKRLTYRRPYKKSYPYQAGSKAFSALGDASWHYVN
jgi:hypothetical protein